jgi:hypothetical protein
MQRGGSSFQQWRRELQQNAWRMEATVGCTDAVSMRHTKTTYPTHAVNAHSQYCTEDT